MFMVTRRTAKSKGRLEEKERLEDIKSYIGLTDKDIQQVASSVSGSDIILISNEAHKLFPYSVEIKRQEKLAIKDWWKQTLNNTKEDTKPLLIFRYNNNKPLVVMDWYDFLELISNKPKDLNISNDKLYEDIVNLTMKYKQDVVRLVENNGV